MNTIQARGNHTISSAEAVSAASHNSAFDSRPSLSTLMQGFSEEQVGPQPEGSDHNDRVPHSEPPRIHNNASTETENQTIRKIAMEEPSPVFDAGLSPYMPMVNLPHEMLTRDMSYMSKKTSGSPGSSLVGAASPGRASVRFGDLEECQSEVDAYSPGPQWATNGSTRDESPHIYHQMLDIQKEEETPDLQFGHEIKRDPQSVKVMQFSSNADHVHYPIPVRNQNIEPTSHGDYNSSESSSFKPVLRTALHQSDSQSTDSLSGRDELSDMRSASLNTNYKGYEEDEDDNDEEHGHTLLESLPTPRVASLKMGFTPESYVAPLRPDNINLSPHGASTSTVGSFNLHGAPKNSTPSLFRSSHSPHSSSSDHSGSSASPKLTQRPRSSIGPRVSNRQSYYDFTGSTANFNLNLSDAVNAQMGNGSGSASNALLPRMKTIEMYRRNARKSNDPELEFQLAQYMMQTALIAAADLAQDRDGKSVRSDFDDASADNGSSTTGGQPSPSKLKSSKDKSIREKSSERSAEKSVDKLINTLFKEAVSSLKRLSERGFADAQYLLGDVYSSEVLSNKPDMERSYKYFMMAAKHGHAEAAYRAALCLQEGWGTNRDASRAIQFYTKAAVRNQPGALYQLGMAYFYGGMGISDNSANRLAGVKWLSRAVNVSNQTYNRAPHELAKIYEVGFKDLVIPDSSYAVKLYAHSADLGFVPSAARLGHAYEFGELGCPQDPNLSIHYYTIAALGNDPKAQLAMCAWYMVGAGPTFPINHDEAYEWALRAALNGLPKAQYTLGFFYENGTGTKRNLLEASKWYHRAAEGGHEKAKSKLASLGVSDNDKRKSKCLLM